MATIEILDPERHADLRVAPGAATSESHLVPVLATELRELAVEYPVVLVKNPETGEFGLFALMGLRSGENVFFSARSAGHAGYVPLDIARQPFLVAQGEQEGSGAIAIDREHPLLTGEGGRPIFVGQGAQEPLIRSIRPVLTSIMSGIAPTRALIASALDNDLVSPGEIHVPDPAGDFRLRDFYTVDASAMAKLEAQSLADLNGRGHLLALHLIAASMANVKKLIALR